ncbi:MAG: threonine/serine dehydratase [Gammaproteobacteria bacterium]|nr:threonine/serine dehydratase [Pseudomonadota bacterium]TDJ13469.1 MAG: threonine/serine dehydratase [Gammaproteobacteria bacterium]
MLAETPRVDAVRVLHERLQEWLIRTPVLRCRSLEDHLGEAFEIHAKLEFLQRTGTFKPRGALSVMLSLDAQQKEAGVTAVSAGNHAIATAFAARAIGTSAKVVMMMNANPLRVERCRDFGAEVVLADDVHSAFEVAEEIQNKEGRFFVHPFEGSDVVLGTATVGLEICEQVPDLDVVIVPIGGGGLCAGISSAVKQLKPRCEVIGVEPVGADSMHRSFASGKPESIEKVATIADSLGAPFALPISYELCKENVDELVLVSDDELKDTMGLLFRELKIAVEPACVASTAALIGPLSGRFAGKKVVTVMCGSNIDWQTFARHANLAI